MFLKKCLSRVVRDARLQCRNSPEGREIAPEFRHPTTGFFVLTKPSKGAFFEEGHDKARIGQGWAPPFVSSIQDILGLFPPLPLRLLGYWKPYLYFLMFSEVMTGPFLPELRPFVNFVKSCLNLQLSADFHQTVRIL